MRPDEDALERPSSPCRRRTGSRARSTPATSCAGHSFSPSAIRDACQQQQRGHDRRRSARGSGRPRRGGCPRSAPGAATLRMQHARAITPTSTSTANTSTSDANQPWWPSHGSVASRSTAPIIAIRIVGNRTRKPQKIERVHQPRARAAGAACAGRARSRPRCGRAAARRRERSTGLPARTSRDEQARAAGEERAADGERGRERERAGGDGYAPRAFRSSARDRGHDLVQVADHRVVGAGEDRRLGVGVDREDLLRALAAGDVLGGAADPARDVEVGRDLRAGLADLVGVRAPAGARHDARAADRARRAGRRAPRGSPKPSAEPTPRPPLTTTFASASETPPVDVVDALGDPHGAGRLAERGRERLDRRRAGRLGGGTACGATVSSGSGAVDARLLEQAAAPAHARDRTVAASTPRCTLAANGRSSRAATCASTSLPRSVPAATTASATAARRARDAPSPRPPARRRRRPRPRAARVAGDGGAGADGDRVDRVAERRAKRQRLQRQLVAGLDAARARVISDPQLAHDLDDRRRRLGPVAEDLGLLALARRHDQPQLLQPRLGPRRRRRLDRLRRARSLAGTDG